MKQTFYRLVSLGLLSVLAVSCAKDESVAPAPTARSRTYDATATRESHLALGNPSGAVADSYYYWNW